MFVPPRLSKQPDTISLDDNPFMAIYSRKCPSFFPPILIEIGISQQIFIKVSNTKFHGNSSSGSRADTWGQTDGLHEANRSFSDYGNVPKITQTRTDELMETAAELP
jgi:hypothetical protein